MCLNVGDADLLHAATCQIETALMKTLLPLGICSIARSFPFAQDSLSPSCLASSFRRFAEDVDDEPSTKPSASGLSPFRSSPFFHSLIALRVNASSASTSHFSDASFQFALTLFRMAVAACSAIFCFCSRVARIVSFSTEKWLG